MKKLILFTAFAASIAFSSCSKDDSDNKKCESCSSDGVSLEACDNGDGTVTVTSGGESQTITSEELGGLSPEAYIQVIKIACTTS